MMDKRFLTDEEIGLGKESGGVAQPAKPKVLSDSDIGFEAPKPSAFESVKDSAIALGAGVTQGIGMLANVAGADNAVSRTMADATQALSEYESPYRNAEKQERARKIKEAEESGSTLKEVGAYLGSFAEAPIDTTLNALGTSLPTLAAGFIPGAGQAAVAARVAQLGLGAAQGAGAVKGQLFDEVKQAWKENGATEEEAAARATQAQSYTGDNAGSIALGGALGAVAGSSGAEASVRRLVGKEVAERAAQTSVLKGMGMGALKEAPMEGLQGGQERLASNLALQNEGFDQGTWTGVAGGAALEATASAPMGAGFGAWEAGSQQRLAHQEQQRRTEIERQAAQQQASIDTTGGTPPASDAFAQQLARESQAAAQNTSIDEDALNAWGAPPKPNIDTRQVDRWLGDAPAQPAPPAPEAVRPSEAMGLRTGPDAGPLENLAARSVDSGLSAQMQGAAALANTQTSQPGGQGDAQQPVTLASATAAVQPQPQEPAAEQPAMTPQERESLASSLAGSDLSKASVEGANAQELQIKLDEVKRRAAENGSWNVPLMAQRRRIEDAMARLTTTYSPPTNEQQALQAELDAEQQGTVPGADRADGAFATLTEDAGPFDPAVEQPQSTPNTQPNQGWQKTPVPLDGQAQAAIENVAKTPQTNEGAPNGPQATQAQQDRAQPAQVGAAPTVPSGAPAAQGRTGAQGGQQPAAAAGLTDAATTPTNPGAQGAPAAGAQAATAAEPEFTTIKTIYGESVTVRTADLNSDKPRLRQYTKAGKSKAVPAIHRENLDLTGDKRAAIAKENADNPFFNVITTKDGGTFANQAAASRELNRLAMGETHEVVAASEVRDGAQGFVIRRKQADAMAPSAGTGANQQQTKAQQAQAATETVETTEPAKRKLPGKLAQKAAEAEAQRADYFTPGNVVKSYGGHDRVISYTPVDERGNWSVRVRAVRQENGVWVDVPRESERTHATQPEAREFKAGPVQRAPAGATQAMAETARPTADDFLSEGREAQAATEDVAQQSPQDFIPAPDGGLDYGEITPDMGKAMRRQAGKIRLRRGDETQGLVHIEQRHNKDFAAFGFDSAVDFIAQVAKGFNKIYKGRGAALDVVIDDDARGMLIVSLEASPDGDFYDIKTATPIRRDQFKNEEPLWERAGPSASTADESSPPYPKGQNGATSVPPVAPAAQPITRADVTAAQQQAAAIMGARIDAVSAGSKFNARQAQEAGFKAREEAKKAQRQAKRTQAAPEDTGLRVGVAPGSADPVAVRDGVVLIGDYEAVNYDTGEPVTVPKGSTRADVAQALKNAGALSSRQKMFGLGDKAQDVMFSRTSDTDQTDTAAFKRWFKDSRVVDADGKPLAMYHGTSGNEGGDAFTYFDAYASNYGLMGQGAYFTDNPEVASSYTTKGKGETPTVYKVFLSIQNPIDMDAKADPAKWQKQFDGIEDFHEGGDTNESWYRAAEDLLRDQRLPMWEGAETMQDGLRAMGFDGITHIGGGRVKSDGVRHRVYIAFEPTQVKSATGNNGNFDPANQDIRRSFAGQQAATADTMALATAQQRLEAGEDAEAVRQETGWFKGNDGKWRFEIDDSRAFLKGTGTFGDVVMARMAALEQGGLRNAGDPVRLGDVLRHESLFAAYPALRDMEVQFTRRGDTAKGRLATDDAGVQVIHVRYELDDKEALSVLLHEIQHGIQTIEGFATGGTPQSVASILEKERFETMANKDDALTAEFDALKRQYAGVPESEIPQEVANRVRQLRSEINAIRNTGWREASNPFARRQPTPEELFAGYTRLAGEVEARNTQARQKLTAEQRRATSPGQTADVADADVIVVFNGKEMANAPMPANAAPDATATAQPLRTPASTIRAAITKAYGKLLGQLESKGLVTLTQTLDQAIEAAAQARAAKTGGDVESIKRSMTTAMQGETDLDVKRSANGAIQGFFDPQTGQSFLVADNLTAEAAPGVLMHEVGIHMAADGSMKALFNRAALMLKAQKADPFMRAVQARMDAAGETSGEEAAAYIAEAYENDRANAPASVQRWLADLLAAVKAWMFKKGIMGADRLTVADIAAVARANARSMARDGGATGGQGFGPAFSVGEEVGAKALAEFAKADELFALPKSTKDTVEGIAADNDAQFTVSKPVSIGGRLEYTVTLPDGTKATLSVREPNPFGGEQVYDARYTDDGMELVPGRPGENPDDVPPTGDVWIDVSDLKKGDFGAKMYNIAATYAHNTGRIFIGDPHGLSKDALRRRLEQMISSALKFGTTAHLAPHPDQTRGGHGVPPLRWVYGDHVGNVERMIAASVKALDNGFPQSKLIEYRDGNFYNANNGKLLPRGRLATGLGESIAQRRSVPGAEGGTAQAGWRTVARAALFRHFQSSIRDAASGIPQRGSLLARGGKDVSRLERGEAGEGAFDANERIFYSRTAGAGSVDEGTGARIGAAIKSVTVTNIKQKAGFKLTDYLGIGLQALGRRQIVDIYGDLLPLSEYNRLVQQMEADKNEGGAEADQLVTRWAKLPDEAKLADLMHDATLAQIDPDKPYVDGDDKAKFMMLQGRFKALSDDAKAVYRETRDAYRAHHANVRSAIKARIERSEIKGERKAALLKQMDDEFFKAVKGVYFPLARFGQYAVTVKGPDGKVESVSRAETKAEAEALRSNLLAAFPRDKGFTVGRVMLSKDFIADRDAVGRGFMTELYQVLDKQDMDAAQRAELEDTLGQLYLSSLPDLSWAKHGIHRKGTPGFSQDARRAFAQNMFHGARYLAKLRYSDLMQDELTAMQRHVDEWREVEDFDQNSAQRVVTEMYHRHESLMNPKSNPLSTALTSLGFVFHLGLSPASAMVNLSQTALVAYPIMGAKWGFGKASAALLKASKQAAEGKNDITGSLNADELAAYNEAVRAGTIDVTMAHDLAGIAQGEDAGVMWKIRPVMRWASFFFHHAERFNRQVTFVAAYRLAREAGADQKAAFEQATKATYDGHFDYGAANRPRIMQGNVAKVLLLFKQYGQNMVYTLSRNAYQSIKGTDAEKAEARKALAGLLTANAMAAGVLGLPMVTTLLAAASMLGGDDDEPWDAKVALQNMLADTFGQKTAEVLAHGLSRLTPWDISGRVGLDRLIFPDVQEGLEGQRLAESAMAAALGPVAGIGVNVLKGAQHMSEGRYAMGLEAMLPSALRGPVKALRYAEEGVQDKSGISILDQVSPAAVAGQALGFSPSAARNAQEGKSAILAHDRALNERRQELLTKISRATMAKDEEAKAEAREEIRRFNEKSPGRRINPNHIMQSVHNRQRRIDQAQDGVYLPKNRRDAMEAGRFAVVD